MSTRLLSRRDAEVIGPMRASAHARLYEGGGFALAVWFSVAMKLTLRALSSRCSSMSLHDGDDRLSPSRRVAGRRWCGLGGEQDRGHDRSGDGHATRYKTASAEAMNECG